MDGEETDADGVESGDSVVVLDTESGDESAEGGSNKRSPLFLRPPSLTQSPEVPLGLVTEIQSDVAARDESGEEEEKEIKRAVRRSDKLASSRFSAGT